VSRSSLAWNFDKIRLDDSVKRASLFCSSSVSSFPYNCLAWDVSQAVEEDSEALSWYQPQRDGGGVFEYNDRIRGYITLVAYLDSMVTDKRQLSSLFTADSIGDLHAWKILPICWSDGSEISATVDLSRETSQTRSCLSTILNSLETHVCNLSP
jgi:hypothetical protein